ncbi:unnamed protein product [Discula destructiva]
MAPTKPGSAFIKRQFTELGRPDPHPGTNKKRSPRYRCSHCQWVGSATSPSRLKDHLAGCGAYQKTFHTQLDSPSPSPSPSLPTKTTTSPSPRLLQRQQVVIQQDTPTSLAQASNIIILASWFDSGGINAVKQHGLPAVLARIRATVLPTHDSPVRQAFLDQLEILHRTVLAVAESESAAEELQIARSEALQMSGIQEDHLGRDDESAQGL